MIKNIKNTFGIILLGLGIFSNPLFLEKVSSPQAFTGLKYKLPIGFISISLVSIGIILLVIKTNSQSIKKLIEMRF